MLADYGRETLLYLVTRLLTGKLRSHDTGQEGATVAPKDSRGRHKNRPRAFNDEQRKFVFDHINSFPRYISHYRRSSAPNKRLVGRI